MGSGIAWSWQRPGASAASLGVARHETVLLDLRQFGASALTSDIAVPKDRPSDQMSHGIPITYVPARNTVFLSLALAYAEVVGAADLFIGVNAVDYSGYPDCRPEFIAAFEQLANLATKAWCRGDARVPGPHAVGKMDQGRDHSHRHPAGRGLWADAQLLRPRPCGRGLRPLRFVPPAAGRICRGRAVGSGTLSVMKIAEIYRSVQGEGLLAGEVSTFVRTSGCNLRCWYCDTPYASWLPEGEDLAVDEILRAWIERRRRSCGADRRRADAVCRVDPAEPRRCKSRRLHITIETAGTLYLPVECDLMSISPKLTNSTPTEAAAGSWSVRHERTRHAPEVIHRLLAEYRVSVQVRGRLAGRLRRK